MENLNNIFEELFGTYQPVIVDITNNGIDEQVVCANWQYIFTVLIFIIILNSSLKILGGVICGR